MEFQNNKSVPPNVPANRHFTVGRVWARIFAQTWHAVKCQVERRVRRSPSEGREFEDSRHCGTRASMRTKKAAACWYAAG